GIRDFHVTGVQTCALPIYELAVLEAFNFDAPKTKELKNVMSNLELSKKVLFIVDALDNNVELSARNIPSVKVIDAQSLNVLDIRSEERRVGKECRSR